MTLKSNHHYCSFSFTKDTLWSASVFWLILADFLTLWKILCSYRVFLLKIRNDLEKYNLILTLCRELLPVFAALFEDSSQLTDWIIFPLLQKVFVLPTMRCLILIGWFMHYQTGLTTLEGSCTLFPKKLLVFSAWRIRRQQLLISAWNSPPKTRTLLETCEEQKVKNYRNVRISQPTTTRTFLIVTNNHLVSPQM